MPPGPIFPGFLEWALYAFLSSFVLALLTRAALSLPLRARPEQLELSRYMLAYLRGGENLMCQAVLAVLTHRNLVKVSAHEEVTLQDPKAKSDDPIERQVLSALSQRQSMRFAEIKGQLHRTIDLFDSTLRDAGLLVGSKRLTSAVLIPTLIAMSVPVLALFRAFEGLRLGEDVSFLCFAVLAATAVCLGIFLVPPHQSIAGSRLLRKLRKQNATLRELPYSLDGVDAERMALSIGLFGLEPLESTALSSFPHAFRSNAPRMYIYRHWRRDALTRRSQDEQPLAGEGPKPESPEFPPSL